MIRKKLDTLCVSKFLFHFLPNVYNSTCFDCINICCPFQGTLCLQVLLLGKLAEIFQSTSNLSERKRELLHGASGSTVSLVTTKAETSSEQSNNKSPGPQGLVYTEIAAGFKIGSGGLKFKRICF